LKKLNLSAPPAFRYPAFRAFWCGMLASVSGFQMLRFGQFWLIFLITESPLALGYVGLANGVPAVLLNLFGGVAADKVDQRRLIMVAQSIIAVLVFVLATLTLLDVVKVWHILTMAFLAGAVEAFDQPARRALFPHLIDRKDMMSAVAMNSAIWPGTRIMAPAVAGLIIAWAGTATTFYISAAGFLTMAVVVYGLKVPKVASRPSTSTIHDLREGLGFVGKNSMFSYLIGMTFFSSFFGMAYIPLMQLFAVEILRVGAAGQGWLMGLGGVGSLLTTIWFAAKGGNVSRSLLIIVGGMMSGISVVAFALTSVWIGSFFLALALMFLVGVFNTMQNTALQASMQMLVPDHIRGRVMGIYGMTYNIRPLGGMQAGALAGLITAPFAIAVGGLAVAIFAIGSALASRNVRQMDRVMREAELELKIERPIAQPSDT
jgi:MFS family permease